MRACKFLLFAVAVTLLASCNSKPTELSLNVMTFNIRMDTPRDSLNSWTYRKDFASELVRFHKTDILGTQEVLHHQLEDMKTRLPEYSSIGVGREDGATKGEYSAIFYKTDKFDVLKSGTFWLAEDINAVGKKGWDAACERVVTWAVFRDKATAKEFCFMNTHFDHIGKVARSESAKLLMAKSKEFSEGLPVIATGDFNATAESDVIKTITDKGNPDHLTDSRGIAEFVYGPDNSFHNYGRIPYDRRSVIDYIFVKGNIDVKRLGVLTEMKDSIHSSDHYPVLAEVVLK